VHAIAAISDHRIVELVVDSRLKEATLFRNAPPKFAFARRIRGICKCLRSVYLQTHGEVAEWPKAAVC